MGRDDLDRLLLVKQLDVGHKLVGNLGEIIELLGLDKDVWLGNPGSFW